MDKYEFHVKTDQIKKLVNLKDYKSALKIAETIDWTKVKNMSLLTMVSEIYEKNGRYEESIDYLMIVYDRYPAGRTVVYKLTELNILLGDYNTAIEYYHEYAKIAPFDTSRDILKYKICKAKKKPVENLIKILESLKEKDYQEEWAYELAKLYHEAGRGDECVAECDEIDLWFGEGPFVIKALELKMLYQPLTPVQMKKYENRYEYVEDGDALQEVDLSEQEDGGIKVKTVSFGKYDTLNLQEELAKSMEQIMNASDEETVDSAMENVKKMVEANHLQELVPIEYEKILDKDDDGQLAIDIPEFNILDKQITGQLTIEEVMAEWERQMAAGQQALEESRSRRLDKAREKALEETGNIMERLADVLPEPEEPVAVTEEEPDNILDAMMEDMAEELEESLAIDLVDLEDTKEWVMPKDLETEDLEATREFVPVGRMTDHEEPEISLEAALEASETAEAEISAEAEERAKPEENIEPENTAEPEEAVEQEDAAEPEENVEPEEAEPEKSEKAAESKPQQKEKIKAEKKSEPEAAEKPNLTKEQEEILSYFMEIPSVKEEISGLGKDYPKEPVILISGKKGTGKTSLATRIIKAAQLSEQSVGKRIAKTTGESINQKDIVQILEKMVQGSLIIEGAEKLSEKSLETLQQNLPEYQGELQLYLLGEAGELEKTVNRNQEFAKYCKKRIHLPVYKNQDLVIFAKAYAKTQKYSIDEMGVLALYTRLGMKQTEHHNVDLDEVKEIMDEAIARSSKFSMKKFFGRIFSSRIDDDGLIILGEKDILGDE